jgi:hypothetical protein
MNNKHIIISFFVTTISIVFAGCSLATNTTNVNESQVPTVLAETPNVSSETGAFHIVLKYTQSGDPVRAQNIYLAEMLPVQGQLGGAYVPALDLNKAPRAESTLTGDVVISLIPPGKYALALLTPVGSILVVDSESNKEITFDIIAGEVTDLGTHKVVLDQEFLEPTIIP